MAPLRGLLTRMRRWPGAFLPGARERREQTATYLDDWTADNEAAARLDGPLWVVLGDSTAQGIGTSNRTHGYVASVLAELRGQRDRNWRAINLSRSGARSGDVLDEQLPRLQHLSADLVSSAVGANDLMRTPPRHFERNLLQLAARLPPGSLFANLPQGLASRRATRVNQLIAELVEQHSLVLVDLWSRTGPPWDGKFSADHFHPNDAGYADWTAAFLAALGMTPSPR